MDFEGKVEGRDGILNKGRHHHGLIEGVCVCVCAEHTNDLENTSS